MNAATKLALAMLGASSLGLTLIAVGLWPNYRIVCICVGALLALCGCLAFGSIWRSR